MGRGSAIKSPYASTLRQGRINCQNIGPLSKETQNSPQQSHIKYYTYIPLSYLTTLKHTKYFTPSSQN